MTCGQERLFSLENIAHVTGTRDEQEVQRKMLEAAAYFENLLGVRLNDPRSHGSFVRVTSRSRREHPVLVDVPREDRSHRFEHSGIAFRTRFYEGFVQGLFSDPAAGAVYLWLNGHVADLVESIIIEVTDIEEIFAYSENASAVMTIYQNAQEDGSVAYSRADGEGAEWLDYEDIEPLIEQWWPEPVLIYSAATSGLPTVG